MTRNRLILAIGVWYCGSVMASDFHIKASAWGATRTAESISRLPPLPEVMAVLQAQPRARITLYHPGGDTGAQWARELRDGLVSLGLSGQRIELVPGNPRGDTISISISHTGGNQ